MQANPQAPQLLMSVAVFTQTDAQSSVLAGHMQVPFTQPCDATQAMPQAPQLAGSERGSTHRLPHLAMPAWQLQALYENTLL